MTETEAPAVAPEAAAAAAAPAVQSTEASIAPPPAVEGGSTPAVPDIAQPVQADANANNNNVDGDTDTAGGVRKKPFVRPAKGVEVPAAAVLTTEQQTAYNSVFNTVAAWTHVPVSTKKEAESAHISEEEQMWLTRECLLRYLRATKWDVAEATARLQATLAWRREYGLHGGDKGSSKLTADYISVENETGKQWLMGYDRAGRPCHYLNPSRQNTERSERQIEHLVFMIERDIDTMPAGQETLALLINFAETSRGQGATVGQGRAVLSILQAHYPERLGRALLINLPWFFWAFMKVITPFIDPLTRQKLVYNDELRNHVPPEQLLRTHGGDVDFEYVHDEYWPALNRLADERRAAVKDRWARGGKRVGELENYLKGGQEDSLSEEIAKKDRLEKEKRPAAKRSGTSRSGGLKVERADGEEQRQRKSVSIYDGREGHDQLPSSAETPAETPTALPPAATTTTTTTTAAAAAPAVPATEKKEQTAKERSRPTSPREVTFTDGKGGPLPESEGTGKRQTSPGRLPRRLSNPQQPRLSREEYDGMLGD